MLSVLHDADRIPQPAGEPLRDYVLSEYAPAADPAGGLHSQSLFRAFLREHDLLEGVWPLVERVVAHLGAGETVWGVKLVDGEPALELYFYDERRRSSPEEHQRRPKSVGALVRALAPALAIDSQLDEAIDYFMCSLELDRETLASGRSPGFRIYVRGNRREEGYDGISYFVRGRELLQENYYLFYRAQEEWDQARARFAASVRAGRGASRARLLPPRMRECFTICFATKRFTDALYFSRVSTDELARFCEDHMDPGLAALVRTHRDELAHLRWDVGYDFCTAADDGAESVIHKAGFYGYL